MPQKNDFNIKKDDFVKLRSSLFSDETVAKIVTSLEQGELVVFPSLPAIPGFDLRTFNWSDRYGITTASQFQLYLHSLYVVGYLTRAYELDGEPEHLRLAYDFTESWMKYESDPFNEQVNPTLWNGHCAALRAENLVYFTLVASDAEILDRTFRSQMTALLKKHGKFLDDYRNYRPHNSQGMYQNRALLYLSLMFDTKESALWYAHAKERVQKHFEYSFTEDAVHIENSYMYGLTALRLFRDAAAVYSFLGDSDGAVLSEKAEAATRFLAYGLKPNGVMPMIGDTKNALMPLGDCEGRGDMLEYSATQGARGEKPPARAAVFPKAGYFVAREFWDSADTREGLLEFEEATWTMFRAGCLTTVHKHADDLSFILCTKGHDVFVDPGFYSFETKNTQRKALASALSHNTVVVDNSSYEPIATSPPGVGISDYITGHPDGYDYVCGYNNFYDNVSIERNFYYFGNAILIFDDIRSVEEHTYSQIFNLGEKVSVSKAFDAGAVLTIGRTGYSVRIWQLMSASLKGGCAQTAKISRKPGQMETTNALIYDVTGKDMSFATLITVEDIDGENGDIENFSYDGVRKIFSYTNETGEHEIRLSSGQRLGKLFVTHTRSENDFDFTASAGGAGGVKYAWYVYEKTEKGWKIIIKKPYNSIGRFLCHFDEGKSYRVKVFACTESGEQVSAVAANISEMDLVIMPEINVTYTVEGNRFSFVNHASQEGLSYAWYVYSFENGDWQSLHKGVYTTDNFFQYEFEKGCQYRVRAFILGENGDRRDEIVAEIEL